MVLFKLTQKRNQPSHGKAAVDDETKENTVYVKKYLSSDTFLQSQAAPMPFFYAIPTPCQKLETRRQTHFPVISRLIGLKQFVRLKTACKYCNSLSASLNGKIDRLLLANQTSNHKKVGFQITLFPDVVSASNKQHFMHLR